VVEQPVARGTGAAVAYGLRRVQALAAAQPAVIGFFPSDHHYANGLALQRTVAIAYNAARAHPDRVFLVGAEATSPESDYGWIEPGAALSEQTRAARPVLVRAVGRFWEKPSLEVAKALLSRGCLWNTFIVIGCDAAFSQLLESTQPEFWSAFGTLGRCDAAAGESVNARRVYRRVLPVDFSREVLERAANMLAVVPMPNAGWTDLGRPDRVLDVLSRQRPPQTRLRLAAS
jgi:mannose-1-phosphate guanylyltransferase